MTNVTRENLVSDVKVVLDDIESLLQQAASAGGSQAVELRERAQTALKSAQERLRELQEATSERVRAAAKSTDDWVHDNPWRAIGAAAGVALLVGVLIGRR